MGVIWYSVQEYWNLSLACSPCGWPREWNSILQSFYKCSSFSKLLLNKPPWKWYLLKCWCILASLLTHHVCRQTFWCEMYNSNNNIKVCWLSQCSLGTLEILIYNSRQNGPPCQPSCTDWLQWLLQLAWQSSLQTDWLTDYQLECIQSTINGLV